MPTLSHARTLAVAGLTVVALGAAAAPAHADFEKTLTMTCEYPLVGALPVTVKVSTDIPVTVPAGKPTPPFSITVEAIAGTDTASDTSTWDGMKIIKAASIEGVATATSTIRSVGFEKVVKVDTTIRKYTLPATEQDLVLSASGQTPSITFPRPGTASISIDGIALNLRATKADGSPVKLPPITIDSDGDVNTFDAPCTIDAGQDQLLATLVITGELDPVPTKPGTPIASDRTATGATLTWAKSTDAAGPNPGVVEYKIFDGTTEIGSTAGTNAFVVTGLTPGSHALTVRAYDEEKNASASSDPLVLVVSPPGPLGPTSPGKPLIDMGARTVTWAAATDDVGVVEYDVILNGRQVGTTDGETTSFTLPAGTFTVGTYTFTVRAVDGAGNTATSPATTIILDPGPLDLPPSAPGRPEVTGVNGRTATLLWAGSTDDRGVTGYEILRDGAKVAATTGTEVALKDLSPGTEYCLTVVAIDASGQRSQPSPEVCFLTITPMEDFVDMSYDLAGSASLKTLTKGTIPLKGSIDARLETQTGTFTADLALAPTKARLTALGFLPVTASVAFVTNGKTTGQLSGGVLRSTSNVRIKLPQVSLFGTIPLAGGTTCQTRQLSKIDLTSTGGAFNPLAGGTLAGTFAISDLSGCGALNGLVSPLTAGKGNTIALTLRPLVVPTT